MSSLNRLRCAALGCLFLMVFPAAVFSQNPFLGDRGTAAVRPPSKGPSGGMGDLQFRFQERAGDLLAGLQDHPSLPLLLAFAASAFLYGVVHGAGPGHRKTVVFSLFLGRKARWFEPAAAGFLAAGVHAGTSMVLILVFSLASAGVSVSRSTDRAGMYLQGFTFLALAVFALFLIIRKWTVRRHRHETGAGRGLYSMLVISSLIPCPGAAMLLLFALSLNLPLLGILGVLSMSVGMGLVISAAGYLAYAGREGLFYRLKGREETVRTIADGLEITSYLLIMGLSLYMAWPFLINLL